MMTLITLSKTLSSPLVVIPLLGTAIDVTTHLKRVEFVNLTPISGEVKVIDGCVQQAPSNGLSDRDYCLVPELGPDGSGACSLAHYGSIFTIDPTFGFC